MLSGKDVSSWSLAKCGCALAEWSGYPCAFPISRHPFGIAGVRGMEVGLSVICQFKGPVPYHADRKSVV